MAENPAFMSLFFTRGDFVARTGRVESKMGIYHILLRGMNELFVKDQDYIEFISTLRKYAGLGVLRVFSYTLLKNRVHLVVGSDRSIGTAMKPLCTSYARYFNRTYQREGKLFYDRLKSEPINSEEELRNVVSFVNSISANLGDDYQYSSLSRTGREICVPGLLAQWELLDTRVSEMFIEDYDCLTPDEIGQYVYALCGVYPKNFGTLSQAEQKEALIKLTKKRWIAKNKLYDILGINRPRSSADTGDKKPEQEKDKGLSVWLL